MQYSDRKKVVSSMLFLYFINICCVFGAMLMYEVSIVFGAIIVLGLTYGYKDDIRIIRKGLKKTVSFVKLTSYGKIYYYVNAYDDNKEKYGEIDISKAVTYGSFIEEKEKHKVGVLGKVRKNGFKMEDGTFVKFENPFHVYYLHKNNEDWKYHYYIKNRKTRKMNKVIKNYIFQNTGRVPQNFGGDRTIWAEKVIFIMDCFLVFGCIIIFSLGSWTLIFRMS